MSITTATPAQIDEQLARIGAELAGQYAIIDQSIAATERIVASRHFNEAYDRPRLDQLQVSVNEATIAAGVLEGERRPFDAEYTRRGGWTRYFLVEGGHLHYDVSAHRCSRIPSTSHYWLTELSGQAAAEVIELAGDRVCTVCFPDAPVVVLNRPSVLLTKTEQEKATERAERATARAKKARETAAKAITAADGSELRVSTTYGVIRTERAAAIELVDCLWYEQFYGTDAERVVAIETLLAALAAKRDTTVDEERAAAEKRLAARIRREG